MKEDLRIYKTKQSLYNALVELLKENTFENIKVQDICSLALINRSTFYAHYKDKYELLLDFINSLKNELINAISVNEEKDIKQYYLKMIELLLHHIDEKRSIYQAMLLNNQNSILMSIILEVANQEVSKDIKKSKGNIPTDVISTFYLGAFVSLGVEWLRNNNKYTIDEILSYMDKLLPDNINEL